MQLQKQSKLFNDFQDSEGELLNFHIISYASVIATELRNEGFQVKRLFDKILSLLWLLEV